MRRSLIILISCSLFCALAHAQSKPVEDFTPVCDTLAEILSVHNGVEGELKLKSVTRRKNSLDFYFTESLGDFPWHKEDIKWFRNTLKSLFPEDYKNYRLGEIYSRKVDLNRLAMPHLTSDGRPADTPHKTRRPAETGLIVEKAGIRKYSRGLAGRHIALWQSHGRYYDHETETWTWQRPCLFNTCEDMFTQGFVLSYLAPMLENAGAYVMMPRERDIQRHEVISDNDSTCKARGSAEYSETGIWNDAGTGFADIRPVYTDLENPFRYGTARMTPCTAGESKPTASAKWIPEIPSRGEYAVYISYRTLKNSTSTAHYSVHHMGGTSEFAVNQKMGGGTWIYLGTFEFDKGTEGYVMLDNSAPAGYRTASDAVVTADAVRFGGGMGNIARSRVSAPEESVSVIQVPAVSGMPRSAEAARYWLQWAGADTTVYYQNEGKNDYRDDFMSRGDWVEWISRGSRVNPSGEGGLAIPIDISLGFHTDAGVAQNDSIVGTLAIYSYRSEGKTSLPTGEDRLTSRLYADIIQSQIVNDLRLGGDTLWTRRSIWDRAYRESRTPPCPAMLIELLSHQNFADMRYGHDPTFRFTVSRSIYKGILKYLSCRFGIDYVVQPLPVTSIGVRFGADEGKAVISWKAVKDNLEPTASPKGYILYRRQGDGAFDTGTVIESQNHNGDLSFEVDITPGQVHSFKISAYNDGGESFPSEVVSIGYPLPQQQDSSEKIILVVNNFDRISGPAYFDSGLLAGFDSRMDAGVPHIKDITLVGEMYNFRKDDPWISNARPGFGASYSDKAGCIVAGNTFDYPAVHGKAILEAGHPFISCSRDRLICDTLFRQDIWAMDMICGKQVTTKYGEKIRYTVFTPELQDVLREFTSEGGNILVSGSYIGTDLEDSIYPVEPDSLRRALATAFANDVLGYRFITNRASRSGQIVPACNNVCNGIRGRIWTESNPESYCVESPDGIVPADKNGRVICRYADGGISAGVAYQGDGYKSVSFGFPIEAMTEKEMIGNIIRTVLEYFRK